MARERGRLKTLALRLRPRIYRGEEIALGPGKIDLLRGIAETGSISQAARRLGMSYMRAWSLVKTMNDCFERPLVRATRGGRHGGRAELTRNGRDILDLYDRMTAESLRVARPMWSNIQRRMKN